MARKKKQSKKTRSRASVVRQDYRKGGRVNLLHGGAPKRSDFGSSEDGGHIEYQAAYQNWLQLKDVHENQGNDPSKVEGLGTDPNQDTTSTQTRSGDNQKTREKIGEALEGKVSDAAKIADPLKVDESIEQTTTTMDKAPAAQTFQASGQAPEAVRTEQTKEVDETIG